MRATRWTRRATVIIGTTTLVAMTVFGFAGSSFADSYEDQCVLAASRQLPGQAQVSATNSSPAPANLISQHHRDLALRWIQVDFTVAVGDRKMARRYLCAMNRNGEFIAFAPDNDPLQ